MKKKLNKGFTLVELVIVIAVIAILSAVLIPTFGNVIKNAKDSAAFSTASNALTKYTTNQAQAGESTLLPDGYVLVFDKEQTFEGDDSVENKKDIGVTGGYATPKYVFEFKNGALIQYQDEEKKAFYTFDENTTTGIKNKVVQLSKRYKSTTNGYAVAVESDVEKYYPISVSDSKATYFGAYVLDGIVGANSVTGKVLLLASIG